MDEQNCSQRCIFTSRLTKIVKSKIKLFFFNYMLLTGFHCSMSENTPIIKGIKTTIFLLGPFFFFFFLAEMKNKNL